MRDLSISYITCAAVVVIVYWPSNPRHGIIYTTGRQLVLADAHNFSSKRIVSEIYITEDTTTGNMQDLIICISKQSHVKAVLNTVVKKLLSARPPSAFNIALLGDDEFLSCVLSAYTSAFSKAVRTGRHT